MGNFIWTWTVDEDTGTINIAIETRLAGKGLISSERDPVKKQELEEKFIKPLMEWFDRNGYKFPE